MEPAEKLSGTHITLLIFSFIGPTIILVIPSLMADFAGQDAWLTVFPAILLSSLCIWVMVTLSKRYPGKTIIQYSSLILGKWPGKILACYFVYYWLNFNFVILNQHVQFIHTFLLMRSPGFVISLTLALVCGVIAYKGIEAIARSNDFISLLIFVLLIPLLLLILQDSDPQNLRPVMSEGIVPIVQGSLFPAAYLCQFFLLGWLLPYLDQPKKAFKASFLSLTTISGLLVVMMVALVMVFGPLTDELTFPVLSIIQYIGITGSFERLEAIGVVIWVTACFVKISLTFFIISLSLGHLFNVKRFKDFIVPITVLSVIGSVSLFKNYATDLHHYLLYSYPSNAIFTQLILPFVLLAIDSVKKALARQDQLPDRFEQEPRRGDREGEINIRQP